MNALWKDMHNLKLSDRGMIWNSDLVETLGKISFSHIITVYRYVSGAYFINLFHAYQGLITFGPEATS
jgi:hypothetical protein